MLPPHTRAQNGKQKNPRRGITFEESFLRNGKKGRARAAKRFRNSSLLFIPKRPQTASPMIVIGRLPIPLSTASRMSTSSTGKTVNYNEREAATTCGGERGLPAGEGGIHAKKGGRMEGFEDAREGRGKRAKTERGTAHHHERNPTSYPRRRSCLSVYSSVYSRGRRPQSIDFTPALPPCPGRLHPRCRSCNISPPAHSRRSSHQPPLSVSLSRSLFLSRPPQFHSNHWW